MSKIKNPLEKKQLSLIKDRYVPAEYPHAFRRQWPRKKKIATRQMRHTLNQLTHQAIAGGDLEAGEARFDKGFFNRRQKLTKWGTLPLGERIKRTLDFQINISWERWHLAGTRRFRSNQLPAGCRRSQEEIFF